MRAGSLLQAVWYLKCRALTLKNWVDDTEIEEEVSWIADCHRGLAIPWHAQLGSLAPGAT